MIKERTIIAIINHQVANINYQIAKILVRILSTIVLMKKAKKIIVFSLAFLLVGYSLFFLFPQIAFRNKFEYKSFIIYSHSQVDKNIFVILDSAENLISFSELYKNKSKQYKIYLCNNFLEFSFFAPTQRHAFACNNPLTNNIFISKSNILLNRVERNGSENNFRTLSGAIAHEVAHTLIENYIGIIKYMRLDTWKNEGYADFIAKESSFDYMKGINSLCNYQSPSFPSFKYFKYRLYIKYLIKEKKLSYKKILSDNFSLQQLDEDIQKKYCQ